MPWEPNDEEKKYLTLISAMTTDSMLGKGVDVREAYTLNLKTVADIIDKLPKELEDG